jgi:hypothetical protein
VGVRDSGDKAGDGAEGAAGGGDMRGVQLAEHRMHAVDVCTDGDKAGAVADGAAGAAGGGDIRRVEGTACLSDAAAFVRLICCHLHERSIALGRASPLRESVGMRQHTSAYVSIRQHTSAVALGQVARQVSRQVAKDQRANEIKAAYTSSLRPHTLVA